MYSFIFCYRIRWWNKAVYITFGRGLPLEVHYSGTYLGPEVDILNILNVIRQKAATMRPLATSTVATCYYLKSETVLSK